MPEVDIKILKAIHERGTATVGDLVQIFGEPYTISDLSAHLGWLEKRDFLEMVCNEPLTYKVSGLGLITLGVLPREARSVFLSVPPEKCFRFCTDTGAYKSTGIVACSLSDFYEKVKTIDAKALEFHVPRGDMEKWFKDVLGDEKLAQSISKIRQQNLKGDQLRNQILNVTNLRIRELTSSGKPQG